MAPLTDTRCFPDLHITMPAERRSLVLLRHVVRGFRDCYAIDATTMEDIVLAVSEAATNAAIHAYAEPGGTFTLVARVEDGHLRVLVRDRGRGIAPAAMTPALGHGLSLIEHVAADWRIAGGPTGTDVLMTFELATMRDPPARPDGAPT